MPAPGRTTEPPPGVRARQEDVAGVPLFWWEAEEKAAATPLYIHGNPTNADDFLPFLARTGGVAPDLPGWGRSGKSAGFDYSIDGFGRFLAAFVDHLGLGRFSPVMHDWGGVGLALAQDRPDSVERVVLINAAPLLPGYRWHWLARIWRTPVLGELFMGATSRFALKQLSRQATPRPGPLPEELIDRVWDHFDHGTQRAALRLYRSAPPAVLARAGERLGDLRCPALVVWGRDDPYIDPSFARAYADALGGPVEVDVLDDAGHWPWVDCPEVVDRVTAFVSGAAGGGGDAPAPRG